MTLIMIMSSSVFRDALMNQHLLIAPIVLADIIGITKENWKNKYWRTVMIRFSVDEIMLFSISFKASLVE